MCFVVLFVPRANSMWKMCDKLSMSVFVCVSGVVSANAAMPWKRRLGAFYTVTITKCIVSRKSTKKWPLCQNPPQKRIPFGKFNCFRFILSL